MKSKATKSLHLVCVTTLLFALAARAEQSTEATTALQEKATRQPGYRGDRGVVEVVSKFKGPDVKGYMIDLFARIRSQRAFAQATKSQVDKPGKLIVEFSILRDGTLQYTKLIQTSGDPSIDQALIDAIQSAAPFQPLSPEAKDKPLKLRWHMEFKHPAPSSSSP
jgi:TonB family protein